MRFKEILREYKRDITAKNIGDQLQFAAAAKESSSRGRWLHLGIEDNNKEVTVNRILEILEMSDPTRTKQYVLWLAKMYITSDMHLEDMLSSVADDLLKFHNLKVANKLKPEHTDIGRFTKVRDFVSMIDQYEEFAPPLIDKGKAVEIHNDSVVRAIVPEDVAASCYYGQGTKWCTAARNNNMFGRYNQHAPLIILIPKKPAHSGEKYQLHFSVSDDMGNVIYGDKELGALERNDEIIHTGQYMDEKDQEVTLSYIKSRFGTSFDYVIDNYLELFPNESWNVRTAFYYHH